MNIMTEFVKRVFGCTVIKAINSNYNADFSGQPRTLPSGVVYATDKTLKYSCKNYIRTVYPTEKVFYFKSLNENMNPISLNECYKKYFGDFPKKVKGKEASVKKEPIKPAAPVTKIFILLLFYLLYVLTLCYVYIR